MMKHNYEIINMNLQKNVEMFNRAFPLLTTTPQLSNELHKKMGIVRDTDRVRLNSILNHYTYCKHRIVKEKNDAITWRLLKPGEAWHSVDPEECTQSKFKSKPRQSTLDVCQREDVMLPKYILDRINDNAERNGLTYQQQVRHDLIKLYENYVIEVKFTEVETQKIDALVKIWGKSLEDARAEILAERVRVAVPTDKPKREPKIPGTSVITSKMMEDYLRTMDGPRSTVEILNHFGSVKGVNDNVVRSKLNVYKKRGYLKNTIKMILNEKNLLRNTSFWTLTSLGRQALDKKVE